MAPIDQGGDAVKAPAALLSLAIGLAGLGLFFFFRSPASESKTEPLRTTESVDREARSTTTRTQHPSPVAVPSELRGLVLDSTGRPVGGAAVCIITWVTERLDGVRPECAESESDGRFSLGFLSGRSAQLHAIHSGVGAARLEGLLQDWLNTEVILRLEGQAGPGLSGKVVDSVGGPIPGATIQAVPVLPGVDSPPPDSIAVSDGAGAFVLPVAARQYEIVASAAGYGSVRRTVDVPSSPVELALAPECPIRGVVTSAQGEPIAGIRVIASREGLVQGSAATMTEQDGSFLLRGLIAGRYAAGVSSDSWEAPLVSAQVRVGEDTPEVRIVAEQRLTFEGHVAVDGAPCVNGSVVLEGAVLRGAELDTRGIARVPLLIAGTYQAKVACSGALPVSDKVEIREGSAAQERTRRWKLRRGHSISGKIRGADGLAREGLTVHVEEAPSSDEGSPVLHATDCRTDESGLFLCAGLNLGAHRVSVRQGFRELLIRSVNVSGDMAVDWSLPPLGTLRITTGARVPLLGVQAEGPAGFVQAERESDAFWLRDLPTGTYKVRFTGESQTMSVVVRSGPPQELALPLAPLQILSGSIVGPDGHPIPDAWIRVSDGSPFASARDLTAQTDAEGRFAIPDVPSGEYQASVETELGSLRSLVRPGQPLVLRVTKPDEARQSSN